MKVYINNYEMNHLPKKLKGLNDYLIRTKKSLEIYSDEGIYSVDENNIYEITHLDGPIKTINYTNTIEMIVDLSTTTSTIVHQLPVNNIILKISKYTYQLSPKSKIALIIQCMCNHMMEYVPYDFYFDVSEEIDINGPMFKEDINVFLFHLN
jgi:hypothetical protein